MNFDTFLNLLNNHWVDWDGAFGNQCFDLAQFWNWALGNATPFTGATADLIYQQAGTFYTQIENTPTAVPQKGDIVVWDWPHVGIATGNNSDVNKFEAFEQNDPTNSNCHVKLYPNYNGVLGWLRPKQIPQEISQATIDELRTARDQNWTLYQGELAKNNDLNTQLTAELTKEQDLRTANDQLTKADADTGAQLLTAQHNETTLDSTIKSIADALGCPPDLTSMLSAIDNLKTPIDQQVKPLQDHALSLQKALEQLIYQRVPSTSWLKGFLKKVFNL